MGKLTTFIRRMEKLGIILNLTSNYPWIYLSKVNGNAVTTKFQSQHGFTLGYMPVKNNTEMQFSDTKEIFKVIRKYK